MTFTMTEASQWLKKMIKTINYADNEPEDSLKECLLYVTPRPNTVGDDAPEYLEYELERLGDELEQLDSCYDKDGCLITDAQFGHEAMSNIYRRCSRIVDISKKWFIEVNRVGSNEFYAFFDEEKQFFNSKLEEDEIARRARNCFGVGDNHPVVLPTIF